VARTVALLVLSIVSLSLPGCSKPNPDAGEIARAVRATLTASAPIATPPSPAPAPTLIATAAPCSVQAADFLKEANGLVAEWDDTNQLADKTARVALAQPVGQLQDLRRRLNATDSPVCAGAVKMTLSAYMDATIATYLAFMGEASDMDLSFLAGKSSALQALSQDALTKVAKNEPIKAYPIEYRAGGDRFGVTYTPAPSHPIGPRYLGDSWTESGVALSGQTVMITVNNQYYVDVFCEIWVNGELAERRTSSKSGGNLFCTYTIPTD
jgi:hypothetical protein